MSKRILKTLLIGGLLTMTAFAGGRRTTTTGPVIIASCHSCTSADAISFSGSGFKAGITVIVDVMGPTSYSITTKVDANGNINVDYGMVLSYASGSYNVTASSVSGKTITPVANDAFDVQ